MFPMGEQVINGTECIKYFLSVDPDEGTVNEGLVEPPPTSIEALSALFSVYKELITELVIMGALYIEPQPKRYFTSD